MCACLIYDLAEMFLFIKKIKKIHFFISIGIKIEIRLWFFPEFCTVRIYFFTNFCGIFNCGKFLIIGNIENDVLVCNI